MPENGAWREEGLVLDLKELALEDPFEAPGVKLGFELRRIEDQILGTFHAEASPAMHCSRCLEPFQLPVKADFTLEFGPKPEDPNPRSDDAEDPGPGFAWIEGEYLPLGEEIRQEMELQVPYAALCREDCAGLCPVCGANRNLKPCGCEGQRPDNPFAQLKKLFDSPKEN